MGRLYDSILETVGHTPVVRINRLAPDHVNLYVKIEAFNPLGSVKDRLALGVIEAAEDSGALKPGQTVIEATSGNTGIGLAMVCAAKGYPLVVTMAESFSVERRRLMRFLGAKVVLTPSALCAPPAWSPRPSSSRRRTAGSTPASSRTRPIRTSTRAPRRGRSSTISPASELDYWVTGYGTGGTLKGVGAGAARRDAPKTKIVVCEPADAADADQRRAAGRASRTARRPPATRPGSRTRCRAGRPTSSPSSPATRSTPTQIDQC